MNLSEMLVGLSGSAELSILVKATVLLTLGLTAARLAAHARASVRHVIIGAALAAVLALPAIVLMAPRIGFDVPVAAPVKTVPVVAAAPAVVTGNAAVTVQPGPEPFRLPWGSIGRGVWIAGVSFQLLVLGLHLVRLRRIRRTGLPWVDRRDFVQSVAAECGVRRNVEVLLHDGLTAPITCGAIHPAILLPVDARTWSDSDLRCAISHELEHVRRNDWVTQLAARAAAACYWFHPLVWAAWRRLCLEAERAADDAVLRTAESTEYAEQLVGLARRMSNAQVQPALGMANRSDLSARVSALLDANQRRGRAGALTAAGAVAVTALMLFAIGPLTAVAQSPQAQATGTEPRRATRLDRALYDAAEAGDLADLESLVKAGANINGVIRGDGSPLIGAARKGRLEAVRWLLDRGADPNLPVRGDGNPLIGAAAKGHIEVAALLLSRGARIDEVVPYDENALIQACGEGRLDMVKFLVARGANVSTRLWVDQDEGRGEWRSPLILARRGRHQAVVDFLLASGARD